MSSECDKDWYFDDVVNRCQPCNDICWHANIQNTVWSCKQYCPGYGNPSNGIINGNDSEGAIIGGSIGSVCLILVFLTFVAYFLIKRKKQQRISRPIQETDDSAKAPTDLEQPIQADQSEASLLNESTEQPTEAISEMHYVV